MCRIFVQNFHISTKLSNFARGLFIFKMKIDKNTFKVLYRWAWNNKFNAVCLAFVAYMVFFSEHSLLNIMALQKQEETLKSEIEVYKDSIESFQKRIDEVSVDEEELERYARENLRMRKENEDLYIMQK